AGGACAVAVAGEGEPAAGAGKRGGEEIDSGVAGGAEERGGGPGGEPAGPAVGHPGVRQWRGGTDPSGQQLSQPDQGRTPSRQRHGQSEESLAGADSGPLAAEKALARPAPRSTSLLFFGDFLTPQSWVRDVCLAKGRGRRVY